VREGKRKRGISMRVNQQWRERERDSERERERKLRNKKFLPPFFFPFSRLAGEREKEKILSSSSFPARKRIQNNNVIDFFSILVRTLTTKEKKREKERKERKVRKRKEKREESES